MHLSINCQNQSVRVMEQNMQNGMRIKLGIHMYVSGYVVQIRRSAFMHTWVIDTQKMVLITSNEGNFLCVYHPSAMQIATLCDWKSRIRMRKRTRIRAYGPVSYLWFLSYPHMHSHTCIWIPSFTLSSRKILSQTSGSPNSDTDG